MFKCITLRGITHLSLSLAKAISLSDKKVFLPDVVSIDSVASVLLNGSAYISIPCVKKIDSKCFPYLDKHDGALELIGLREISDEFASRMAKKGHSIVLSEECLIPDSSAIIYRNSNPKHFDWNIQFIQNCEIGYWPIHRYITHGLNDVLSEFLANGNSPNSLSHFNTSALHICACYNNIDAATMLIEHGAKVDVKDQWGSTPLHFAAESKYFKMYELLIDYGADKYASDIMGLSPESIINANDYCACELYDMGVVSSGKTKYCIPDLLNIKETCTPLHWYAACDCVGELKSIIKMGFPVNCTGSWQHEIYDGYVTPLNLAVIYDHVEAAKILIDAEGVLSTRHGSLSELLSLANSSEMKAVLSTARWCTVSNDTE